MAVVFTWDMLFADLCFTRDANGNSCYLLFNPTQSIFAVTTYSVSSLPKSNRGLQKSKVFFGWNYGIIAISVIVVRDLLGFRLKFKPVTTCCLYGNATCYTTLVPFQVINDVQITKHGILLF